MNMGLNSQNLKKVAGVSEAYYHEKKILSELKKTLEADEGSCCNPQTGLFCTALVDSPDIPAWFHNLILDSGTANLIHGSGRFGLLTARKCERLNQ